MSIIDRVVIAYDGRRDLYVLLRGGETFYVRCEKAHEPDHWKTDCWECDHRDQMRTWLTPDGARNWAIENLGVDPFGYPPAGTIAERLREHGQLDLPLEAI